MKHNNTMSETLKADLTAMLNHLNSFYLTTRMPMEVHQITGVTNYSPQKVAELRSLLERGNKGAPQETAGLEATIDSFYKDHGKQSYITQRANQAVGAPLLDTTD